MNFNLSKVLFTVRSNKMSTVSKTILTIFLSIGLILGTAEAANKKKRIVASAPTPIQTSLVVDGKTGKILHEHNARERIYPASLTKIMTLYLLFEALESGKLSLDQRLPVSKYASEAMPLKLFLKPGDHITVRDAALAIPIKSANDVARVVAEAISGSEDKFAKLMTARAKQLGMKDTTFANASGWHDPRQKTTAIDLAKLAIAIKRDFPQYYHLFSETSFEFRGKRIHGHNKVVAMYPGAEGLKTGYTIPAGRNLITTATRGNKSLVGVITGSPSTTFRDNKMVTLLDKHFGTQPITTVKNNTTKFAKNKTITKVMAKNSKPKSTPVNKKAVRKKSGSKKMRVAVMNQE